MNWLENLKAETFGEFFNLIRVHAGWTMREMAAFIGVSPSYICDIEADRRIPSEDVCTRLAEQLCVDPEGIICRTGNIGKKGERSLRRNPWLVALVRRYGDARLTTDQLRRIAAILAEGEGEK